MVPDGSGRIYDVLIVGAGPAGSATAILLARQGYSVLSLDRSTFPRDKPCGEFVTPGCAPILRDLGVWDSLEANGLRRLDSAIIQAGTGRATTYRPADDHPAGWSIRRTEFDLVMVERARMAGAHVVEGVRVRSILREGRMVVGVTAESPRGVFDLRSRLVIGADGTHSLVGRELGLVRPIRRLQRIAIVSHWDGLLGKAIEMRARGDSVCGFGPLSAESANVTLVVPTAESSMVAGRAAEFLVESLVRDFPDLASRLPGLEPASIRTIGCFGHTTSSPVSDGAMLVGDAACFIDPFTGEGIYFALRGGEMAAKVAAMALEANDMSASRLGEYSRMREELTHRYRLCDVIQKIVRRPRAMDKLVGAMQRNSWSRERLMTILGDVRPAKHVLNPRLFAELLAG